MPNSYNSKFYVKKINPVLYEHLRTQSPKIVRNFALTMMLKEHFIQSKKEFETGFLRVTSNIVGEPVYELVGERKTIDSK